MKNLTAAQVHKDNFPRQEILQDLRREWRNYSHLESKICTKVELDQGLLFSKEIYHAILSKLVDTPDHSSHLYGALKCILKNKAWAISRKDRVDTFIELVNDTKYQTLDEFLALGLLDGVTEKDMIQGIISVIELELQTDWDNFGITEDPLYAISFFLKRINPLKLDESELYQI